MKNYIEGNWRYGEQREPFHIRSEHDIIKGKWTGYQILENGQKVDLIFKNF